MSEQDNQQPMNEVFNRLERMTPAAIAVPRDELFFRAGEASARSERATVSMTRRALWPAAAAVLAMITGGLAVALVSRTPEIKVVYVERPTKQSDTAAAQAPSNTARNDPGRIDHSQSDGSLPDSVAYRPRGLETDDLIYRQDWAALSDAFAQQLRLQQARTAESRSAALAAGNDSNERPGDNTQRKRPRTYLEMRDALQTM
jgi:hypothetical protein